MPPLFTPKVRLRVKATIYVYVLPTTYATVFAQHKPAIVENSTDDVRTTRMPQYDAPRYQTLRIYSHHSSGGKTP